MQLLDFVWRCAAAPARGIRAALRPAIRHAHPGKFAARHAGSAGLSAVGAACRRVPLALALATAGAGPFLAAVLLPAGPFAARSGSPAAPPSRAGLDQATREAAADVVDVSPAWSLLSGGDPYLLATLTPSVLPFAERPLPPDEAGSREAPAGVSGGVVNAVPEAGSLPLLAAAVFALAAAGGGAAMQARAARRPGAARGPSSSVLRQQALELNADPMADRGRGSRSRRRLWPRLCRFP